MGDSGGVIRVNVSVPRDVKARMDAAGRSVNWSAVATAAFRAKLAGDPTAEVEALRRENEMLRAILVKVRQAVAEGG